MWKEAAVAQYVILPERILWRGWKKTGKTSVRIEGVTAEIRTGHFQNMFTPEGVTAWLNFLDSVALKGLVCMPRVKQRYRLLCSYWLALSSLTDNAPPPTASHTVSFRTRTDISGCFPLAARSAHCLIISWLAQSSALKMETICSSELHGIATQNTILFISLLKPESETDLFNDFSRMASVWTACWKQNPVERSTLCDITARSPPKSQPIPDDTALHNHRRENLKSYRL
jgi:hypothetical protein